MDIDDYIKVQGETDYFDCKAKYWNPAATKNDSINSFYDSLYSSSKMVKSSYIQLKEVSQGIDESYGRLFQVFLRI